MKMKDRSSCTPPSNPWQAKRDIIKMNLLKKIIWLNLGTLAILLSVQGCKKDDTAELPSVITDEVTDITENSAKGGGNLTSDGGANITSGGLVWSENKYPTIHQNEGITDDGTGRGQFESDITELSPRTSYYVRAYATNSEGTAYGNMVEFTTNSLAIPGSGVTDIDGNEYNTVIIGNQEWMAENLRTTKYADGTEIPFGLSDSEWENTTEGAYSVYPHENVEGIYSEEQMVNAYGKLYNWYAVDDERGLCPAGWHVSTEDDWNELLEYLEEEHGIPNTNTYGGAANVLKAARQIDHPWDGNHATYEHPRWDNLTFLYYTPYGTDDFGFSAFPAGSRSEVGSYGYGHIGSVGRWWTSTLDQDNWNESTIYVAIRYNRAHVEINRYLKRPGYSVRCIRNEE